MPPRETAVFHVLMTGLRGRAEEEEEEEGRQGQALSSSERRPRPKPAVLAQDSCANTMSYSLIT